MNKETNRKKKPLLWFILAGVSLALALVFSVSWIITSRFTDVINKAFGLKSSKVIRLEEDEKEQLFVSDYEDSAELKKADMEVAERLTEEGAVLLKNNGALPLADNAKVTLLGHASTNMLVCGTGSADIDATLDTKKYGSSLASINGYLTLKAAIEERTGISVNEPVWNTYMNWTVKRTYVTNPEKGDNSIRGGNGNTGMYSVNEVPWSTLTAQSGVTSSFSSYKDAAIVVIARLGGEMYDIPASPESQGNPDETVNGSGNALELTVNETELIKQAKKEFGKVIVLINSANPLECDFLTAENSDVDAALWIGYTGLVGLYGVADLLVGNATPSGRLVDTYCNDNLTSPAMINFYSEQWTNASSWGKDMTGKAGGDLDGNQFYNVYQEGIYVGYRYYETIYEDFVMGRGNTGSYNYLADVAYPFGYGLSYTTFSYSNPTYTKGEDGITVKLTVTNTGEYSGKDVVEVYFQSEYTDYDRANGIEKAAIELCGFAKTDLLEKGESEEVEIFVPNKEFRTYDRKGYGTYIMDAGQYYLTIGCDAHDALNNVLAKKGYSNTVVAGTRTTSKGNPDLVFDWKVMEIDSTTYSKSYEKDEEGFDIVNQFDSAELSYYGGEDIVYLSRNDWMGTAPTKQKLELNQKMHDEMTGIKKYEPVQTDEPMPTMGSKETNYRLSDMTGLSYDDPKWESLLNQITYAELCELVGVGYHGTKLVESISKPQTSDENGPQGFSGKLTSLTGADVAVCAYTDENIMAATWNVVLMKEVGEHIGEDGLHGGYSGLYGPAMNTHRTPYSGRNFEYYSEDGFLGGKIAAAEVEGIQSKGVYVFIKHFALNDEETNCRSISTFANEQAIREIYLEPFEHAVVEGGAYNVMNAFARVGVIWTGAHYGLMTNVLRNEWGCEGFGISDYTTTSYATTSHKRGTYDAFLGVIAGTDTFDSSDTASQAAFLMEYDYTKDPHLVNCMREAAHRICYVVANSNAMNTSGVAVKIMNWWQFVIIDGIIDFGILAIVFGVVGLVKMKKQKKED